MFLPSLIVALLASAVPALIGFLSRRPVSAFYGFLGIFGFTYMLNYFCLPALVGPFWGLTLMLIVVGILGIVLSHMLYDSYECKLKGAPVLSWILPVAVAALGICLSIGSSVWFVDDAKIAMVGDVKMVDDWRQVHTESVSLNPKNIRIRDRSLAGWKAQQAIANSDERGLGSRVSVGEGTIQKINSGDTVEQLWAFPLEHAGFWKWWSYSGTPGYIVVSAEDESSAELVTTIGEEKIQQNYMPSAHFGENAHRYLYQNGYSTVRLEDFTYELDDNGRPHWVVTLTKPTKLYAVREVTGVLILDPQTGEIDEFAEEEFDQVPAWVDRIYSDEVFLERVEWYGSLRDGWWNSFAAQEGVVHPTEYYTGSLNPYTARFVIGDDGQTYWVTGVTSVNTADTALDGFVLMNTRTGKMQEYRASGLNEAGALAAIDDQVSNYANWSASQPIVYNVYDRLAVVAPITADGQRLQSVAVVDLQSEEIAIGETVDVALAEFARVIGVQADLASSRPTDAEIETIASVVRQIGSYEKGGYSYAVVQLEDMPEVLLSGRVADHIELSLTREGDPVEVEYLLSDDPILPIRRFDNGQVPRSVGSSN